MKGRTPRKAEREHMERVRELGCIVCRLYLDKFRIAAIHHVNGRTKPGCHLTVLPLCFDHHQGGADSGLFISVHPYKARFEAAYGSEFYLMKAVDNLLETCGELQ